MNNLTYVHKNMSTKSLLVVAALLFAALIPVSAKAFSILGSQMSVGARGSNVSSLQSYLASNYLLYPEGMVTGYFGPLTRNAVTQFQLAYNIPAVGSVGPITLAKLNSMITNGDVIDISSPDITNRNVNINANSATLTWNTSENARAKVFYSTSPLSELETSASQTEPIISGAVWTDGNFGTAKSATLSGLQSNTTYYYVIESIDAAGNVRVTDQSTFRTNS